MRDQILSGWDDRAQSHLSVRRLVADVFFFVSLISQTRLVWLISQIIISLVLLTLLSA